MIKRTPNKLLQRISALALALVLVLGALPADTFAAPGDVGVVGNVTTVADPDTISRPADVYGDDTLHAGKVTVGKSVSDAAVTLAYGNNQKTFTPAENNFIVTSSQTSQVLGLATEQAVPVDVVFVLDTSGSMDATDGDNTDRAHEMVTAANDAIATLMESNSLNRVGVVAFSSRDGSIPSAQVLSPLASYTGSAATNHLQWVTSNGGTTGNNRGYIAGRNANGNTGSVRREGHEGGTNIHAGVALGGQQLTGAATTTATLADGSVVTRMPFLVILSDGQPTFIADDENGSTWYNPAFTNNLGNGNDPYEGAGFMVALTAAYYKGKITEHYYGDSASNTNRCNIYTLGVQLEKLTGNDKALAQITMNPAEFTTGTYAEANAASYWNYGNSHSGNNRSDTHGWKTYWEAFNATNAKTFPVRVNSGSGEVWVGQGAEGTGEPQRLPAPNWRDYWIGGYNGYLDQDAYDAAMDAYEAAEAVWQRWHDANYDTLNYTPYIVTADSIAATKSYVNAYGGIAYNDGYYSTDGTGGSLSDAFTQIVTQIQKLALAAPTHIDAVHGADFSGYVTYSDPIGEYMEVKAVHGVLADGNLYQGKAAAQKLSQWNSLPETDEFKSMMRTVLRERCRVTGATMSDAQVDAFLSSAANSDNQASYNSDSDYDNSIVWWGQEYTAAGEEDPQVKWVGFADNDSYEYITTTAAPAGATHVCRSYYYVGTAGNTIQNPETEYLHFVVRVQRSLTAPYQQTVVISAPASLLSTEKVFVTEKTDSQGNKTYEAEVTPAEPARVVYEVGLRSDINAFNVDKIVGTDTAYVGETTTELSDSGSTVRSTNYDAATGTYTFYTNDWNRAETNQEHHRAMAKATFEAAATNSFYTYTEDTLIYSAPGTVYTGTTAPAGTVYYAREYYDWAGKTPTNGVYPAEKKVTYIPVNLPDNAPMKQEGSNWYIPAGVFKASSLISNAEDVPKSPNNTQTAEIIVHPHRTTSATDNHYTVLLGNNGKLTLEAEKTKSVYKNNDLTVEADGKVVMVGDTLTYQIKVVNPDSEAATATVTDTIPKGTQLKKDDQGQDIIPTGAVFADGKLTWSNLALAANEEKILSFDVVVTTELVDVVTIDNTAYVKLSNGFEYETNTVKNPPEGKRVVDTEGKEFQDGDEVQVQDVLVFRILWQNDTGAKSTVTVTDIIPSGTTYVEGSADHDGVYDAATNTLKWVIEANPDASGVVSFRASVNAASDGTIENHADIKVGNNDPRVTNTTTIKVKTADLTVSKEVLAPAGSPAFNHSFTLNITEAGQDLNGTYELFKGADEVAEGITFTNGSATLRVKHGETFTVKGIPAGVIISVTEQAKNGYTPAYYVNGSTDADSNEGRLTVADGSNSVKVENTYAPIPASFQLTAKKVLDTSAVVEDITFGFTAQACEVNGTVLTGEEAELLTGEVTVSSKTKEATVSFSPLTFDKPGTYFYLVDEIQGGVVGVEYAKTQYKINITVTDDGSGQLKTDAIIFSREGDSGTFSMVQTVTFTNKYAPKETELVLEGRKTLNGRTLKAGEFSFEVKENGKVVSTGTNKADGTIEFKPISYKEAGNHTYEITEVDGGLTGVEYSNQSFTVTVSVVDNNGQLVATPSYPAPIAFINTFEPEGVQVVLQATKTLIDRSSGTEQTVTLRGGEFNFTVTDAAGKTVANGTNNAAGAISFSPIGYTVADDGKTFTYTVSEIKPDLGADPYMTYDTATFQVSVAVTYDAATGVLTATPTYPAAGVDFKNYQNAESIQVTPKASKTTDGNVPQDATFSFKVINADTNAEAPGGVGSANGDVSFTALSFSQPGTYRYWIQEGHTGTQHGITYDATKYLLVVDITLTDGVLAQSHAYYQLRAGGDAANAADYTEPVTTPSFHNVYAAKGQIAITAKKSYNRPLQGGEFGFTLVREGTTNSVSGVLAADGTTITFANLYFDDSEFADGQTSKTIRYTMSEVIPATAKLPGVTYDTTQHPVYITITHDQAGAISAMVTDANGGYLYGSDGNMLPPTESGVVFTNTYAPVNGTSVTFGATKELEGRSLRNGEFTFNLYHVTSAGERLVGYATNDANGNISFTRNYPAGVLNGQPSITTTYHIREVNNHLGGVSYDEDKSLVVTVVITDDGQGNLSAVADKTNAGTFQNTYTPSGTDFTPTARKVLNNRTLTKDAFSFEIKDSSGKTVSTGMNAADGTVTFSKIGYSAAGIYKYTVNEVKGNLPGVVYDETVKYLQVTVTDDGNGNLSAAGKLYSDPACTAEDDGTFTNNYVPTDASVKLTAKKVLTGRAMTEGEFSFVAKDPAGNVVATGGNAAANAGATANVIFSDIGYKHSDLGGAASKTYDYTISELKTSQGGVTFCEDVYYVRVTVTYDSTTGEMKAAAKYYADENFTRELTDAQVKFTNTYKPKETSLTLPVDKTLLNKQIAAGEFTFELRNSQGTILETKQNDASGKVSFSALRYTVPGVYMYTVSEKVTDTAKADLYTLDDPFTVMVTVKDDLKGNLVATAEYYVGYTEGGENTNLGGVEFINHYTAPSITVPLSEAIGATKALNGRDLTANDKFTFTVYDNRNNVVSTGSNDAAGKITFTDFTFKQAGLYHYWITEDDTSLGGITKDSRVWEVHILVRYNEKDANLTVDGKEVPIGQLYVAKADVKTYAYQTGGNANVESAPAFVNTYTPAPVVTKVEATKTLTGRDMNNQEFLFQLIRSDGVTVGEARNDAQGKVTFDLHYTTAGTRTYTLKEVDLGTAGVDFDDTEYTVTVAVTDDGNGALHAAVSYNKTPVFENTYTPAPVKVNLEARKTYSGDKEYDGGIFQFQLVNKNDATEVYTSSNDTTGVAGFEVELTRAGTYTYTMSEVTGTDTERFTYDTNTYDVTIVVKDDLMGQLVAEVFYNTNDALAPVFVNKYTAEPVHLSLEGHKELTGRDMKAGDFTFRIVDGNGLDVQFSHDKDGNLIFPAIDLPEVGTYVFTVTEVKGTETYMTYDAASFEITVTVVNENGVLKETVEYPTGGVVFRNTYTVPETTQPGGSPDTGDNSNVLGFGTMAVLSLGMAMALVLVFKRRKAHG